MLSHKKLKTCLAMQTGKATEVNSWLNNSGAYSVVQGQTKISLSKDRSAPNLYRQYAIWTDGFGNPYVKCTAHQHKLNNYQFYSHFNPAWNELVWNDAFPKW
jgi:hypothetical protein